MFYFNRQPRRNKNRGFTLIEVIMSVAVFALLAGGIIVLVSSILRTSNQQSGLLSDQDQARRLVFQFVSELRNAAIGADGSYSLNQAGAQQIIFFTNLKGTGNVVSRVRYYISGSSLMKGVTAPTGSVYNLANEVVTTVQNNLANGANPVFYYYDGTYNGNIDNYLSQPVNLNQVKLVKITLQIYNKAGVTNTNTYTISSSATIRNLKTNLGN